MKVKKLLVKLNLVVKTLKEGGCTIDMNLQKPHRGYMVGVKSFTSLNEMVNTPLEIGQYFGGWCDKEDNNKLYWDISQNVGDYKEAIELAKKRGELAIFDIEQGISIYL